MELESKYNEKLGEQSITIYPNPTGGAFAVRVTNLPEGIKRKMLLYTTSGKELFRIDNFEELSEFDVSAQSSGTYILEIIIGDKRTRWKIVKQ